jgi:hypothetical protein
MYVQNAKITSRIFRNAYIMYSKDYRFLCSFTQSFTGIQYFHSNGEGDVKCEGCTRYL